MSSLEGHETIRVTEWSKVTSSFFVHVFHGIPSMQISHTNILVLFILWNQMALTESAVLSRWRSIVEVVIFTWGHVLSSDKTSKVTQKMNVSKADRKFNIAVSSIAPYSMAYPGTWTPHNPHMAALSFQHSVTCRDSIPSSLSEVPCHSCSQVVVESKALDQPVLLFPWPPPQGSFSGTSWKTCSAFSLFY